MKLISGEEELTDKIEDEQQDEEEGKYLKRNILIFNNY